MLKAVPHRHFVFSIPKILRRYFLYDRKLLSGLSRCAWETLKLFFQDAFTEDGAVPGAVVAIQSFGDFLGFNPHLHILCSAGCKKYQSKDGKSKKVFDALEWLAAMCSHVPNKGEQMVRYYGYYSNVARGKRKKAEEDELIPSILEPEGSSREYRKNWARLIQKIYEVDPLTCPKCSGP